VLAADRGGLPELVGAERTLPAGDRDAWARAIETLWRSPERRASEGEAALARARERFGEDAYYERLLALYG
jgi:glycosyltransferase involved in cell wall biosynthesis